MIRKIHKEVTAITNKIHSCKTLEQNKQLHIEYNKEHGWLYVDESVKIAGHENCAFATGICFCPYCGERL